MSSNVNRTTSENLPKCPECGGTKFITDPSRGEIICMNCGAVIEEHLIDDGPEWRAFTNEEKGRRARVGSPSTLSLHDKGLSTEIGWEDRDVYGKRLSPQQKATMYRLKRWHTRSRVSSSMDRNLVLAMSELDRLSSQLGLSRNVKETAALIYRSAIERQLIKGRSIEAMIAAAVYAAARLRRVPRTIDEIAQNSRVSRKELGRSYRLLVTELQLKIPPPNPVDYIVRFASELRLSGRVTRRAVNLLTKAKAKGLTVGKDPTGLAAAALYIASILEGERRTQREIAETATVTEVTVRNRYKELVKQLDIEVSAF